MQRPDPSAQAATPGMKRILLIGLNYHRYTQEIVREMRAQGHQVSFHDIQPGQPVLKLLRKFAPRRYPARLGRYHQGILQAQRSHQFDIVLFIQVHQMALPTLQAMRQAFSSAQFVLYNWDAVSNHDYRAHLPLFDRAYTFDPDDAQRLGLQYLPLFCISAFQGLRRREASPYSVYHVGNLVNPRRHEAIHAFKQHCHREGIAFRYFLAGSTHALTLLLRRGRLPLDVSLRAMADARFIDLIETSAAVFDFANHDQAGYTMRVIENLCAGKKIITNNARIVHEPFYSSDRIHVFTGLDFAGVKAFLATPLRAPTQTFAEFHLSRFVQRLVDDRMPALVPTPAPAPEPANRAP